MATGAGGPGGASGPSSGGGQGSGGGRGSGSEQGSGGGPGSGGGVERALVLGGGGVTGVAWEVGVLAGLADHGVDLTDADLVVGTSAGSVVGVDVRSGLSLAEFYQVQCSPVQPGEATAKMGRGVMIKYARAVAFTRDPVNGRTADRVGRAEGQGPSPRSPGARSSSRASRSSTGPPRKLQITAVDAATGTFTVFDADSGVSLIDAVGASCAVPGIWPPVTIDGKRYIDGGMRSATNADLAAGYRRVADHRPADPGVRADRQRRHADSAAYGPGLRGDRDQAGQGRAAGDREERARPGQPPRRGQGRLRAGDSQARRQPWPQRWSAAAEDRLRQEPPAEDQARPAELAD